MIFLVYPNRSEFIPLYFAMAPSAANEQVSTPADDTALDVNLLKEIGKQALVAGLNSVRLVRPLAKLRVLDFVFFQVNGAKTLVLDPSLAGPLGLVTEVALLKVVDTGIWFRARLLKFMCSIMAWIRCSGSNRDH